MQWRPFPGTWMQHQKNRGVFDALFPRRGKCRWGHLKKSLRENNLAWVQKDLSEPSRTVSWLAPFPYPPPADAPWSISNDLQRPLAGIVSCDTKTGPLGASFLPAPFFLFRGHIRQITLRGQREYSFRLYVRNFAVQCSLLVTAFFLGGGDKKSRDSHIFFWQKKLPPGAGADDTSNNSHPGWEGKRGKNGEG